MRLISVFLTAILLASASSHAAKGPAIAVPDGWEGNIYTDDNGRFANCTAGASYINGTTLLSSIDTGYRWTLAFGNDAWRLVSNSQTTIFIRIDSAPWKSYVATALQPDILMINVPSGDQEMINLFRFGRWMEIRFDTWEYQFDLKGTARLLSTLAQCVQNQLSPPKVAKAPEPKPKKVAKAVEETKPEDNPKKPTEPQTYTGTGVMVSEAGLILTNNHVVDGCTSISFSKEGDLARKAAVLRTDKTNDLALLKSDQQFKTDDIASFRISPSMKAGEQIAVYGFPLSGLLSVSGNVVSGNISSLAGLGDDVRFYQVSAPVQPGNSGGPLLDYAGNVVGVVTSRIDDFAVAGATGSLPQNVNFAIKSQIATSFMDTHGVQYKSTPKADKGDLAAVVDAAKKYTVFIECTR